MSYLNDLAQSAGIQLSDEQLAAASHHTGPALTLAIPGSGKTTLLLCRTLNLIETHKVAPEQILSVTFSKAAAQDMAARYQQLFGDTHPHNIQFSTIHRFAYGIVRAYGKHIGKPFQLIEDHKGRVSKGRLLRQLHMQLNQVPLSDDKFDELTNAISYAKNMMLHPEAFADHELRFPRLAELYTAYEKVKQDKHLIDFDDMLCKALEILNQHPNTLAWYQKRYPYIQVDETQDTSRVQHEIIRLLSSKTNNLFMVADDDQSIYGFRGADPGFLLTFQKRYPTGKIYWLSRNYRCGKSILSACSSVIQRNTQRYDKRMLAANDHAHPVRVRQFETMEDRDRWLVEALADKEGSTGVLYRNNLSAITLVDQLERANVSFHIRDRKLHFFSHWMLRDVQAFLNLSLVGQDLSAFERVVFKMNGYISRKALEFVKSNHRGRNVFSVLLEFPGAAQRQKSHWTNLSGLFERMGGIAPLAALTMLEQEFGYMDYLEENAKRVGQNFDTSRFMMQVLKQLAAACDTHLDFLQRLDHLSSRMKESGPSEAAVRLSTMHGSKGLEYDRVFVIDVEDGLMPSRKAEEGDSLKLLEEERRLLYVAMSRARTQLEILTIKFRGGKWIKPSAFLDDLRADAANLLEEISEVPASPPGRDLTETLSAGQRIIHLRFGDGTILDINEDIIRIDFGDTTKALSLPLCLEKGFLKTP